jgi:hypothetical protein
MRLEVLIAVTMKYTVIRDVTLYSLVVYLCFERTYCLQIEDHRVSRVHQQQTAESLTVLGIAGNGTE